MLNIARNRVLLAGLLLFMAGLSCSVPEYIWGDVPVSDEERTELNDNFAGSFEAVSLTEVTDKDAPGFNIHCQPNEFTRPSETQTLSFEGNNLVITNEAGTRTYENLSLEKPQYCEEIILAGDTRVECISNFQAGPPTSYSLDIFDSEEMTGKCYSGIVTMNPTDSAPIAENGSADEEGSGDADGADSAGEGADDADDAADEPPEEGEQLEEDTDTAVGSEDAAEGDDSPPDVCVAYPEEYEWLFLETTIQEGSRGTLCQSTFQLQNRGESQLLLYALRERSAGSTGDRYAGYGPGGVLLAPGEVFERPVNQTLYTNGEITFDRYTRILVLYDTPDCRWMDPTISDDPQIMDSFVTLLDPCNDS